MKQLVKKWQKMNRFIWYKVVKNETIQLIILGVMFVIVLYGLLCVAPYIDYLLGN